MAKEKRKRDELELKSAEYMLELVEYYDQNVKDLGSFKNVIASNKVNMLTKMQTFRNLMTSRRDQVLRGETAREFVVYREKEDFL